MTGEISPFAHVFVREQAQLHPKPHGEQMKEP